MYVSKIIKLFGETCEMIKKEIIEAIKLYHTTTKVVCQGDAICGQFLTFKEVEQNKREALVRLQKASKEDLINYLISDNVVTKQY